MVTVEISQQEQKILEILRTLIPFEEIRIVKDRGGRPDDFFVVRTQKVVITQEKAMAQR